MNATSHHTENVFFPAGLSLLLLLRMVCSPLSRLVSTMGGRTLRSRRCSTWTSWQARVEGQWLGEMSACARPPPPRLWDAAVASTSVGTACPACEFVWDSWLQSGTLDYSLGLLITVWVSWLLHVACLPMSSMWVCLGLLITVWVSWLLHVSWLPMSSVWVCLGLLIRVWVSWSVHVSCLPMSSVWVCLGLLIGACGLFAHVQRVSLSGSLDWCQWLVCPFIVLFNVHIYICCFIFSSDVAFSYMLGVTVSDSVHLAPW